MGTQSGMGRVFGALAIFAGWLSIPIGAMAGLLTSEFFGLSHVEGDLPPVAVYGLSGPVVLWVFAGAAIVTAVPLASAIVATDPRRPLKLVAVVLAIAGAVLLPDQLGRSFGLPLLVGAASLWVGGELMTRDAGTLGSVVTSAPAPEPALDAGALVPSSVPDATVRDATVPDAAGSTKADSITPSSDPALSGSVPESPPQKASKPIAGRGRRSSRGRPKVPGPVCPWCSTEIEANAEACPNCGATLDEQAANQILIPGLTAVPPALQEYAEAARRRKGRTSLLRMMFSGPPIPDAADAPPPSDAAALRPPSPELKAEMARLDAEIAAGVVPLDADGALPGGSTEGADRAGPEEQPQPPVAP